MKPYLVLVLLATTAGCTTLGTNVKGSFACRAPAGTCAPISTSDREAVAKAGGRDGGGGAPASMMSNDLGVTNRSVAGFDTSRTGEHVLKVVFPAHVDQRGIYHDEATVHAVVDRTEWVEALRTADAGDRATTPKAIAARTRTLDDMVASAPRATGQDGMVGGAGPTQLQALVGASEAASLASLDGAGETAAHSFDQPTQVAGDYPSAEAIARARAGSHIGDRRSSGASPLAGADQPRSSAIAFSTPVRHVSTIANPSTVELNRAAYDQSRRQVAPPEAVSPAANLVTPSPTALSVPLTSQAAPPAVTSSAPPGARVPAPTSAPSVSYAPTTDPAVAMARVREALTPTLAAAKPAELPQGGVDMKRAVTTAAPATGGDQ